MVDNAEIAALLRALGHDVRLNILQCLLAGEATVGQIEVQGQFRQPLLSQQLAVLRKAELVKTRRDAKQVYYSIAPQQFAMLDQYLAKFAADQAAPPLAGAPHPVSAAVFAKMG